MQYFGAHLCNILSPKNILGRCRMWRCFDVTFLLWDCYAKPDVRFLLVSCTLHTSVRYLGALPDVALFLSHFCMSSIDQWYSLGLCCCVVRPRNNYKSPPLLEPRAVLRLIVGHVGFKWRELSATLPSLTSTQQDLSLWQMASCCLFAATPTSFMEVGR